MKTCQVKCHFSNSLTFLTYIVYYETETRLRFLFLVILHISHVKNVSDL